jgi:hypothetical protein
MLVKLKTALAVLFVASLPLHLGAELRSSSSAPLTAKEVRSAEKEARTANDHLRLATWYRASAGELRSQLTEQENLAHYYWVQQPGMVSRTKIPNPYWSAQTLARVYREKLENATKLADSHQKLAASLTASSAE